MAEKGEVLAICSEEEDRAGEVMDPPLPKMWCLVTLKPVEEKEGEPHLKASVIAKGEGNRGPLWLNRFQCVCKWKQTYVKDEHNVVPYTKQIV